MAATKDQMAASIEPGSLDYGSRAPLVDGIPTTGGAPAGGPGGGPGAELPVTPGSPVDMMLGGDFPVDENIAPTAGLSVGSGPGPALAENENASAYTDRLRAVALGAKSPALRAQARAALKILYVDGRL